MDKFEYKVRADEIKNLIGRGDFVQAAEIADTIDWRRVKSVIMLCTISDLYKINRRYEDAKNILLLAYDRRPGGRTICYSLCELCLKTEDIAGAWKYYNEFMQVAPKDSGRYILQYKIYEAQGVNLEERIDVLEELKKRDYREKWAYELAYLYHRIGLGTRCVEECDEMILWFGEGKYVIKAMELKMLHQPLTPQQQEKYDHRFDAYNQPAVSEENVKTEPAEPADAEKQNYEPEEDSSVEAGEPDALAGDTIVYEGVHRAVQEQLSETPDAASASEQAEQEQPEELDFHVKTMDMGQYNTLNLQAELAAGLREVLGDEQSKSAAITRSIVAPMLDTESLDYPELDDEDIDENDVDNGVEQIESTEVFFGETEETDGYPPEADTYAAEEAVGVEEFVPEFEAETESAEEAAPEAEYETEQYSFEPSEEMSEITDSSVTEPAEEAILQETETSYEAEAEEEYGAEAAPEAEQEAETEAEPEYEAETEAAPEAEYEARNHAAEQVMIAQPPKEIAGVLSQESDGQISLVIPQSETVEKQITGQMSISDILAEWERMKKEGEERRKEEVRQRVLQQTGNMFTEFEASMRDGLLEQLENDQADDDQTVAAASEAKPEQELESAPEYEAEAGQEVEPEYEAEAEEGSSVVFVTPAEPDEEDGYVPETETEPEYEAEVETEPEQEAEPEYEAEVEPESEYEAEPEYEAEAEEGSSVVFVTPAEPDEEDGYVPEAEAEPESEYEAESEAEPEYEAEAEEGSSVVFVTPAEPDEEDGYVPETETEPEYEAQVEAESEYEVEPEYEAEPEQEAAPESEAESEYQPEPESEAEPEYEPEVAAAAPPVEFFTEEILVPEQDTAEEDGGQDVLFEIGPRSAEAGQEPSGEAETEPEPETQSEPEKKPEPAVKSETSDETSTEGSTDAQVSASETVNMDGSADGETVENLSDTTNVEAAMKAVEALIRESEAAGAKNVGSISDQPAVERDKAKIRALTREEKELFAPYIQSRAAREQLAQVIDGISMASYTGNVIIIGDEGMDTITLAKNIIREVQMTDSNFSGKVAKISGQSLNNKNIAATLRQLENGALIIQKASGMNSETAAALHKELQKESLGIVVVMEDTRKSMNKLLESNKELEESFTAKMEVQALSNDMLVLFAKQYAKELEYAIDELGVLALHTRIEEMQTLDHAVTVLEVKQIVDDAIHHASRKTLGHFMDILLAKRYDEEDMIVLNEKDFA